MNTRFTDPTIRYGTIPAKVKCRAFSGRLSHYGVHHLPDVIPDDLRFRVVKEQRGQNDSLVRSERTKIANERGSGSQSREGGAGSD